jgi:hypothetical protein
MCVKLCIKIKDLQHLPSLNVNEMFLWAILKSIIELALFALKKFEE